MRYETSDSVVLSQYAVAAAALTESMMLWREGEVGDMRDHLAVARSAIENMESTLAAAVHNERACSSNFASAKFHAVCDKCYNDIVETAIEDYPAEVKSLYRLRK